MAINFPEGSQDLPARVIRVVSDSSDTHSVSLASDQWHTVPNLAATLTPLSSNCKILVLAQISWHLNSNNEVAFRIQRSTGGVLTTIGVGSGTNLQGVSFDHNPGSSGWQVNTTPLMFLDSPSTSTSVTYTVQAYGQSGSLWLNRSQATAGTDSVAATSTITALEVIDP